MLQKKLNIKGLRKRVLKLEYINKLMSPSPSKTHFKGLEGALKHSLPLNVKGHLDAGAESKPQVYPSGSLEKNFNYRILILRNVPIEDTVLKQCLTEIAVYEDTIARAKDVAEGHNSGLAIKGQTQIVSKCIKKNILKKILNAEGADSSVYTVKDAEGNAADRDRWLQCKFMYWITPEASSLTEQLVQLNHLKSCIRAEPKDAFLGCLLESRFQEKAQPSGSSNCRRPKIQYKYYYPAEILNLCDIMDKMAVPNKATGLEVLGQLLHTLESSVNSMSFMLALKTAKEQRLEQDSLDPKGSFSAKSE